MPFLDLNGLNHFKDKMMALLNGKLNEDLKGASNGLAELDSTGKVPSAQLPSSLDDVREYASRSVFPETGEAGIIYVSTSDNKLYRWGRAAYVELTAGESGGGSSDGVKIFFGECVNTSSWAAKVVNNVAGFALEDGVLIIVRFKESTGINYSSSTITLNINNTGAKGVYFGATPVSSQIGSQVCVLLRYNGAADRYEAVDSYPTDTVLQVPDYGGSSYILGSNSDSMNTERTSVRKLYLRYDGTDEIWFGETGTRCITTNDIEAYAINQLIVNKYGFDGNNVQTLDSSEFQHGSDDGGETYYFVDPYTNEKRYAPNGYLYAPSGMVKKFVTVSARFFMQAHNQGGVACKLDETSGDLGHVTMTAYDTDNNVIYTDTQEIRFCGYYIDKGTNYVSSPTCFEMICSVPYENLGRINVSVDMSGSNCKVAFGENSFVSQKSADYHLTGITHEIAYTDFDYDKVIYNPTTVEVFNFALYDPDGILDSNDRATRQTFSIYEPEILDNRAVDHVCIGDSTFYPFVNVSKNSSRSPECITFDSPYVEHIDKTMILTMGDKAYVTDRFRVWELPTIDRLKSIEERLSALEA